MTTSPLVSVAIITYNQKEYLRECLDSILSQDYENFEIVVADDGSTDGTHEMLGEYVRHHPQKFVLKLSKKNHGITQNSNLAHFACSGKYIAWMGGDDLMLPEKIRTQVEYMEQHPECSICYHNLDVFESSTGKSLGLFNSLSNARSGKVETLIRYGTFNGACSSMLRTSKTPKHGFDTRVPIASDWLYWVQTLRDGGEIHYLDQVLGRYRRHSGNVTRTREFETLQDHLVSCALIASELPEFDEAVRDRMSQIFLDAGYYLTRPHQRLAMLRAAWHYRFRIRTFLYYWKVRLQASFGRRKPPSQQDASHE